MNFNEKRVREFFRFERLRQNFKLKDLEEEKIERTLINKYELGKRDLNKGTVTLLFDKLGIKVEDLPYLISKYERFKKSQMESLRLQLKTIESELDCANSQNAFKKLRELDVDKDHPFKSVIEHLKGKYYYKRNKFDKARTHHKQALYLFDRLGKVLYSEYFSYIKPACFNELGIISFRENRLIDALHYVDEGIKSIQEEAVILNNHSICYKYYLLISKAIFLERLNRSKEAEETLEEMWPSLHQIGTEVQLNMYDLHATILKKQGSYKRAIDLAYQGIEIARREKNYDRCFELWTTLGSCYKYSGELELARKCFQTASTFDEKIRKRSLLASNDFELGLLYLQEKKIPKAQTMLEHALKGLKAENDAQKLGKALFALGECYFTQSKDELAVKKCEEALDLAQQHSYTKQVNGISLTLARYYEDKNIVKHQKYLQIFYKASIQLTGGENKMISLNEKKYSYEADPPNV